MRDFREVLFAPIKNQKYTAVLRAERSGILSGFDRAAEAASNLGIGWECTVPEGGLLEAGKAFARISAGPEQIAMAEEVIIGTLAKASGIATAARHAADLAGSQIKVVAGAWKKMPPSCKELVRTAVLAGGLSFRICEPPMIYMDKNYVCMYGSVAGALEAVKELSGYTKVVQIRGLLSDVEEETLEALHGGCDIFMVDTGKEQDLDVCIRVLREERAWERVQVAFAGNVKLADISRLAGKGVSMLCVGKEIVDAPLLDMKLDVIA